MSSGSICQEGTVLNTGTNSVIIRITVQSACAACHARDVCRPGDMEDKTIDVYTENPNGYHRGQRVKVFIKESTGWQAVMYGYLAPFVVLFVALFVFINLTGNEALGALISLALLVPYYLILYLFRDRMRKKFRFSLEPAEEEHSITNR